MKTRETLILDSPRQIEELRLGDGRHAPRAKDREGLTDEERAETFIADCPAHAQKVDSTLGAILLDSTLDFSSYPSWSSAFFAGCLGGPT